jgi:uncharacterized membrane-anchored protein YitT (DUF2179 family)
MNKKDALNFALIIPGALLYALATVLFVFPNKVLLGGTSGVAVILAEFLPLSSGNFSVMLNLFLIVVAFAVLGRNMAVRTLIGSLMTTVFIGVLEPILTFDEPLINNGFVSALLAGVLIAIASGALFYVDSSSGGTDILALIIKKYKDIDIGKALLISDVVIVVVGGILAGWVVFLYSTLAFLIKTLGIDLFISLINKTLNNDAIQHFGPRTQVQLTGGGLAILILLLFLVLLQKIILTLRLIHFLR